MPLSQTMWNPEIETMERSLLESLQLYRLKKTVEYVYERNPFYRKKMKELGVEPRHIRTLADLRLLPLHHQVRSAGQLPGRHLHRAPGRADALPCVLRHHGQAHRRGQHPA